MNIKKSILKFSNIKKSSQINAIHKKIGRNIILFQKLEMRLKEIISTSNFTYEIDDSNSLSRKTNNAITNQTMGNLVSRCIDSVYVDNNIDEDFGKDSGEQISFSYKLKLTDEDIASLKKKLASIVEDRNLLVHHFSIELEQSSIRELSETIKKLDDQWYSINSMITYFNLLIADIQQKKMFLFSDDIQQLIELQSIQSDLYMIMEKCYVEHNNNGWVQLSLAGPQLKEHVSKQLEILRNKYNYTSIKSILEAMQLFDIKQEETIVFYRPKVEKNEISDK